GLRRERSEFEEHSKALLAQVEEQSSEARTARHAADHDRARFVELRRRLKRRWRAHWSKQDAAQRQREKELEGEWQRLADEADRVQRDRDALREERLRCNAEMELDRRRLREERAESAHERSAWVQQRNQDQAHLNEQAKALWEQETL